MGLGIEHLLLLLEKNGIEIPKTDKLDLYIACASKREMPKVVSLVKELRDRGVSTEFDTMDRSLKAQMKYANKIEARYVLVIGEEELLSGRAALKSMNSAKQEFVNFMSKEDIDDIAKLVKED